MNIDPVAAAIGFGVLLLSLTIHEAAHAWTADKLGDPTARALGRVSFNPLVHIDWIGTVLLPIIAAVSRPAAHRLGETGAGQRCGTCAIRAAIS